MQFPVIGDMISVKNLKECLSQLDDKQYICVDNFKNLLVFDVEYFDNGRFKDVKCKSAIEFFLEELKSFEVYKRNKESEKDKWGY